MIDLFKLYNNGECLIKYATIEEINCLLDTIDDHTFVEVVYQCTQEEFDKTIPLITA